MELRPTGSAPTFLPDDVARQAVEMLGSPPWGGPARPRHHRGPADGPRSPAHAGPLPPEHGRRTADDRNVGSSGRCRSLPRHPALLAVIDHVRLRDVSYSSLIAAANVVQLGVIEALLDASAYIGLEDGGRSLLRSITNAPEPVFDEFMRDRRLLHGCGPASHGLGESAGRRSGRAERPSLPGSLRAIDGSPVRAGALGAQRSN